jgi:predicted deacylase
MVMEYEVNLFETDTNGKLLNNRAIHDYFTERGYNKDGIIAEIIEKSTKGSIVLSFGKGDTNLMLIGGVHGNELPPQVALMEFVEKLYMDETWDLNCTLYIAPCLIPHATMLNSRYLNSVDMNRYAKKEGVTKNILDFAIKHDVVALCDCHATDPYNKPGVKSVFCSVKPLIESCRIAKHIEDKTASEILPTACAGKIISGAVEDEANLRGISSVTCEVVSPVGDIQEGSIEACTQQFLSFLDYFDAIHEKTFD